MLTVPDSLHEDVFLGDVSHIAQAMAIEDRATFLRVMFEVPKEIVAETITLHWKSERNVSQEKGFENQSPGENETERSGCYTPHE